MVIELCVVQFWSEIILVISNQTRAARSFDFEITRMISDQIALHSVQLPLFTFTGAKWWVRLLQTIGGSNEEAIWSALEETHPSLDRSQYGQGRSWPAAIAFICQILSTSVGIFLGNSDWPAHWCCPRFPPFFVGHWRKFAQEQDKVETR